MKKIILFLLISINFCQLKAQKVNTVITKGDFVLDFKSKNLTHPDNYNDIKRGDFITVRVINYNPYLYKVSIGGKDSSVPMATDGGFLSTFLNPDKLSTIVSGLSTFIDAAPNPPTIPATWSADLSTAYFDQTKQEKAYVIRNKNDKAVNIINAIQKKQFESIKNAQKEIRILSDLIEQYLHVLVRKNDITRKLSPTDSKEFEQFNNDDVINKIEDNFKSYNTQILTLQNKVDKEHNDYKIDIAPYSELVEKNNTAKTTNALINSFYEEANTQLIAANGLVSYKNLEAIIANFQKMAQNSSTFISLPIYLFDDVRTIDINLIPIEANSILPTYQTSFPVPNMQKHIWGISGGIFVTGLHSDNYTFRRNQDSSFNLVQDNQGNTQLGINTLAYFGNRFGNRNNFYALCFGAGMSIEKTPKPRVLFGASYITGDKNKVMVSIGYVGGYVGILSSAYNINTKYVAATTNYQKDILKGGIFLSINYSFLSK